MFVSRGRSNQIIELGLACIDVEPPREAITGLQAHSRCFLSPEGSFYTINWMPLGPTAWSGKWTRVAALRPPRRLLTSALVVQQQPIGNRVQDERGPQLWNDFDSYGMTLMKFRNGRRDPIPRDAIVGSLARHGCRVPRAARDPMKSGYLMTGHTAPHSASMRFSLSGTAR